MALEHPASTRAGFFLRAAALAIDAAVVLIFTGIAYYVALTMAEEKGWGLGPETWRWLLPVQLVPWLLYSLSEVFFAATIGKVVLGLSIRTPAGTPASTWRLFDRWSTKNYPFIVFVLYALFPHPILSFFGGFMRTIVLFGCLAAVNDDHLAWHDEWSGTAVWRRGGEVGESASVPAVLVPD